MQFFGTLKLFMALLGPTWANLVPKVDFKIAPKVMQKVSKNWLVQKITPKTIPI